MIPLINYNPNQNSVVGLDAYKTPTHTFESIEKSLHEGFEKGLIDENLLNKSLEELDLLKGEGSKGGKVIGHTKSGKPIYAVNTAKHLKTYNSKDHEDAAYAHLDHSEKLKKEGKKDEAERHSDLYDEHMSTSRHKKRNEELDKED